ncbi:MAG: M20 family peptidase [Myxococcales bacterium]|nr:M20 family peptidase [Myxococcales bacterium]
MKWVVRIVGALVAAVGLLVGVLLVIWGTTSSKQRAVEALPVTVDAEPVIDALAAAVRLQTVSRTAGVVESPEAFDALQALLEERFPLLHGALAKEVVDGHSLLFRWEGTDGSLQPGLLLSHQDVVPVEALQSWDHPPFSGARASGSVYGRGTLDNKGNLITQFAAVESLLGQGFAPARTLYLVSGHDEEVSGAGAKAIAELLERRGVSLAFVLDEGGTVADGVFDGLEAPVALIGVSEKGYASVEVVAQGSGGHSSMPPPHTAAGRIGAAAVALESNPLPATLDGPTGLMIDALGPELGLPMGLVFTNRWLLGGVVTSVMAGDPKTNATIRTTTAVTMLQGSIKDNVLPQRARLVVNFRIAPGHTKESVLEHVRRTVGPDLAVALLGGIGSDPSPISEVQGAPWEALNTAIRQTWPTAVVAPYLTVGATDARHFTDLSRHVYRFTPARLTSDDLGTMHGNNEHISEANVADSTAFYVRFVQHAAQ